MNLQIHVHLCLGNFISNYGSHKIMFWHSMVDLCDLVYAGRQGVSGAEGSVLCWFPCNSASLAQHWCWSNWNRVLLDGAHEGRLYHHGQKSFDLLYLLLFSSTFVLFSVRLNLDSHVLACWHTQLMHRPPKCACWHYIMVNCYDMKSYTFKIQFFIYHYWAGTHIQRSSSSWSESSRENSSICGRCGSTGKATLTGFGITETWKVWERSRLLQETGEITRCTQWIK